MSNITSQNIGMVFIHGAGLGSWIWSDLTPQLHIPSLTIDFPKRQESKESHAALSLQDYVDDVLQQIEKADLQKIILVGHSLGGLVAVEVANKLGDRLVGFIGVGAAIPQANGSFISVLPFPKRLIMSVVLRFIGTNPPASQIKAGLCNDLSSEQSDLVVKNFKAEALRLYTDRISSLPDNVASMYIRLTNDQEFGISLQTTMARNLPDARIVDVPSGHLPMLSQPKILAEQLNSFIQQLQR